MNWEAVTAIGTVTTAIVIALTVVFASRQLTHLRRATQLEGLMAIRNDLESPTIRSALIFVRTELPRKMREDPEFRRGVQMIGVADDESHQELYILRLYENVGTWVKHGIVDADVVLDLHFPSVIHTWLRLQEVVAIHRGVGGDSLWVNFEALFDAAVRHGKRYSPDTVDKLRANWETERAEPAASMPPRNAVGRES